MTEILADTGPLVAYLDRSDRDHAWAKETFMRLTRPLLTCEAVIAEALFLLRRGGIDPDGLLNLHRAPVRMSQPIQLRTEIGNNARFLPHGELNVSTV